MGKFIFKFKNILNMLFKNFDLKLFKIKWRKNNKHNFTRAKCKFPISIVKVGKYSYGPLNIKSSGCENEGLTIGNYCSIGGNVIFMLAGNHKYTTVSTYPFKSKLFREQFNEVETLSKGPIILEDDVWIGENSLILSGVKIGQGAIIGAGSVVAKDIPPYAIFAGGSIKKYRFSEEYVEKLKQIDYDKIGLTDIKNNIDILYSEVSQEFFISELYKKSTRKE